MVERGALKSLASVSMATLTMVVSRIDMMAPRMTTRASRFSIGSNSNGELPTDAAMSVGPVVPVASVVSVTHSLVYRALRQEGEYRSFPNLVEEVPRIRR